MAYTYTSSVNSTGNSNVKFRMGYELVSQGINGGTPQSVINVVLQTERTYSGTTTNKQGAATTMTVDGTTYSKSINYNVGAYSVGSWNTIWTNPSLVINHSSSTGAKDLTLGFSINLSGTSAGTTTYTFAALTLPTIPMGSTLALDRTSYTISSSNPTATATITKYNTNYYHMLYWYLGSTQIATQSITKSSTNPQTKTYTLTAAAWLPNMANVTSAAGSCILRTYSDAGYSNEIGVDSTVSFAVVCTKTPTATISVSPTGGISNQWIGGFVKAVMSATAAPAETGGSTITKYEYLINGSVAYTHTVSNATSDSWTSSILNAGSYTFGVRVTDSRGLTATATVSDSITVESYSNPNISNISIFRSNGSGSRTDDGTYIYVKAKATATGTGNSITTFKAFTKLSTASSWTDKGTIDKTGTNASEFSGYPNTNSYNVKLEATDSLGVTSTYTTTINTASYTMDFKVGGLGIGIGKVAENDNQIDTPWQFRTSKSGGAAILASSSTANVGVGVRAERSDTAKSIGLLVGTAGINRGLYLDGSSWLLHYDDTNLIFDKPVSTTNLPVASTSSGGIVSTGAQTFSGIKKFANGSGVYGGSNPTLGFFRPAGESVGGVRAYTRTVNSKPVLDRFYFIEYSYDSTTGDPITYNENYYLPSVAADKTGSNSYEILTSKNKVTIAQGGTGQGAPSTVTTGIVSSVDGATLSVQQARKWGKCCDLYLEFSAGTVAGGSSITATVASGYLPALGASGCGYWSQSPFIAQLDSSGNLSIRNASGTSRTFSSTSPLRIAMSYQIA